MNPTWFNLKFITGIVLVLIDVQYCAFLTQLHVVFRHGERSPTDTFPNDPYINYNWPGGWGQLTNRGKLQIYELGKRIRSEYSYFIPKTYWHKDVNVTSSYSERCLMSAELFCAGLFPPEGEQIWNIELLWQPIPVYYLPRNQDKTIAMKAACPKYDNLFKEIRQSSAIMEIERKYEYLKDFLSKETGMSVNNIEDVESISNTLEIEKLHNFSLPIWANDSLLATIKELGARNLALYSETQYMKRVKGGMFLKDMILSMEKIINDIPTKKLHLYAAHDLTIVHILRALGLVDVIKPDYGASLIFELYSDGEVKINYRNSWNNDSVLLVKSDCVTPCKLVDFKKSLESVLPGDYNTECLLE